jgi:hypothetical protein
MRRNWQRLRASERNDCVVTDVTNNSRNTVDFVNSHNSFDGVDGNNDFDSNNSVDSHNFANTVDLGNVDDHLDALDDDDDVVWRFINNNIVDWRDDTEHVPNDNNGGAANDGRRRCESTSYVSYRSLFGCNGQRIVVVRSLFFKIVQAASRRDLIVGVVVAIAILLVIILIVAMLLRRRRRRAHNDNDNDDNEQGNPEMSTVVSASATDHKKQSSIMPSTERIYDSVAPIAIGKINNLQQHIIYLSPFDDHQARTRASCRAIHTATSVRQPTTRSHLRPNFRQGNHRFVFFVDLNRCSTARRGYRKRWKTMTVVILNKMAKNVGTNVKIKNSTRR